MPGVTEEPEVFEDPEVTEDPEVDWLDVEFAGSGETVIIGVTLVGEFVLGRGTDAGLTYDGMLGTANPVTILLLFLNNSAFFVHSYFAASCKLWMISWS